MLPMLHINSTPPMTNINSPLSVPEVGKPETFKSTETGEKINKNVEPVELRDDGRKNNDPPPPKSCIQ